MLVDEVNEFTSAQLEEVGHESITLSCDYAGSKPVYLFYPPDGKVCFYSNSLTSLLECVSDKYTLLVNSGGLSELLLNGFIRAPETIYQNLFILSIGDSVKIKKGMGGLELEFFHSFKFNRAKSNNTGRVEKTFLLEKLFDPIAQARKECSGDSFLFHSAGKDSNGIALAIAEGGLAQSFQSITYRATDGKDESDYVAKLARRMGFEHTVVDIPRGFSNIDISRLEQYFYHLPFPCMDNASLMYAFIGQTLPKGSLVLDGMGNDIYSGHLAPRSEFRRQFMSSYTQSLGKAIGASLPTLPRQSLAKSRAHITGFSGYTYDEIRSFFPNAKDSSNAWHEFSQSFSKEPYIDFRARVRGVYIDTEKFARKVRNAGDVYGWNVVFPWANQDVASYIFNSSDSNLYDLGTFRNKLFLRKLLKDRIGLDSEQLGKMAFAFDYSSLVTAVQPFMEAQFENVQLFETKELIEHYRDLNQRIKKGGRNVSHWNLRLYRLFVICSWLNLSKYLNPKAA